MNISRRSEKGNIATLIEACSFQILDELKQFIFERVSITRCIIFAIDRPLLAREALATWRNSFIAIGVLVLHELLQLCVQETHNCGCSIQRDNHSPAAIDFEHSFPLMDSADSNIWMDRWGPRWIPSRALHNAFSVSQRVTLHGETSMII